MADDRLQRVRKMAERFSHNGSVDKITLRKINALVQSSELEEMTAERNFLSIYISSKKEKL